MIQKDAHRLWVRFNPNVLSGLARKGLRMELSLKNGGGN